MTIARVACGARPGRGTVRAFRQVFDNKMSNRLTDIIEQLSGRNVLSYQSQVMFSPDRIVEMFVFDDQVGAQFNQRDHSDDDGLDASSSRLLTS